MVVTSKDNIRMSDKINKNNHIRGQILRQQELITTDNGPHFTDCDKKVSNGEPVNNINVCDKPPSPVPEPALSCKALKHAVSALTRIDDFILEEIGCGFFATVYKATHKVTGEEMVMKINKDYANRSCALREVQLMNRLSHPNILRFLGVCVHEGQLHALTEYISGGTLEDMLADKYQELPWLLRIKLALDIAKGMNYLHSQKVIHRDLTSKNVLIKKGLVHQAVIADFGLATKIPDPLATEPLPTVGCPWWMAPEVINGKFYDQRADLFSFGIIMLEITGRIEADPDVMPRTKKFGVDYVKVGDLVEYCPLDFLRLAFMCCRVLPEMRPSSEVITITLEQMHKSLRTDQPIGTGKLRKRSKSEDNILQMSDSFTEFQQEETLLTPQIIAQAMTKDDPHYIPSNDNPFAKMTNFKDGKKVHEYSHHHRFGCNSSISEPSHKCFNHQSSSHNFDSSSEKPRSQSLPSSPIMLKRAAEKMHFTSLHGSNAVHRSIQQNFKTSFNNQLKNIMHVPASEHQTTQFNTVRTRSLGSVDFFSPRYGPGYISRNKGNSFHLQQIYSSKAYHDNSSEPEIKSFVRECKSLSKCTDHQNNDYCFQRECDLNINSNVTNPPSYKYNTDEDYVLNTESDSESICVLSSINKYLSDKSLKTGNCGDGISMSSSFGNYLSDRDLKSGSCVESNSTSSSISNYVPDRSLKNGSCGDSTSMSSSISNYDTIDEEEASDVFSASQLPFTGDEQKTYSRTVGSVIYNDFCKPQIVTE